MISNNSAESQAPSPSDTKAGTATVSAAVLNPRKPIEVASGGSGPINNPPGADIQPPVTGDSDLIALA